MIKKKNGVRKSLVTSKKITTNVTILKNSQKRKVISFFGFLLCFSVSVFLGLSLQSKDTIKTAIHSHPFHKAFAQSMDILPTLPVSVSPTSELISTPTETPSPTKLVISPSPTVQNPNDYCVNVPIFLLHHIEPWRQATKEGHGQLTVDSDIFDQQMQYMSSHSYTSVSLQQLVDALRNHQGLPPKSFAVTLDDGYADAYQYAWPIFKKYHVIGNLMIPTGLVDNPGYLTWSQLKEMNGSDVISIYNHTFSHAPLGSSKAEKIQFEMTTSQEEFQSQLGKKPIIMAYPYGSYNDLAISLLQQDGFIAAITTNPGHIECESNLMRMPRVRIGDAPMSSYGY